MTACIRAVVLVGITCSTFASPGEASLIGDEVSADWISFLSGTAIVGSGVEFSGGSTIDLYTDNYSIDVLSDGISVSYDWFKSTCPVACGGSTTFPSFIITVSDLDWVGAPDRYIGGVEVLGSNGIGVVSFDAHSVHLAGGGARVFFGTDPASYSESISVRLLFVPESGSSGLVLGGLIMLASRASRRSGGSPDLRSARQRTG